MKWCYYHDRLVGIIRAVVPEPKLGAEIGVYRGIGSRALLASFPKLTLIAVDPWETGEPGVPLTDPVEDLKAAKAAFLRRTGRFSARLKVVELPSVKVAPLVEDNGLDFVFIDGNHAYDSVKADIEAWWPKVRSGGLLSGHDYNDFPSPHQVKPAVDNWIEKKQLCLQCKLELHLPGRSLWWCQKP